MLPGKPQQLAMTTNLFLCPGRVIERSPQLYGPLAGDSNQAELPNEQSVHTWLLAWLCRWAKLASLLSHHCKQECSLPRSEHWLL